MPVKKVVIVTNIPNPYRVPLFNEVNRLFLEKGIRLKVLFGSKGYSRRKFNLDLNELKFDYELLHSKKIDFGNQEKTYFSYRGMMRAIRDESPDVVIVSGFSVVTIRLWLKSFLQKTKYIIWSGSIHKKGRNDSWLRVKIREFLVQRAYAFIAYGSKSKEYLLDLGAAESKVFIAINTVDTNFFAERTNFFKDSKNKIDNKKHLTYVGYLSSRKNVTRMLECVKTLSQGRKDFVLDLIGEGDDRLKLQEFVRQNNLTEVVRFHGFIQKERLPEYFAVSDCFLFQTDFDIWGLVLNEAMAAGLPVISSTNSGAASDLIKEGKTGFAIDFNETDQVVKKINWILDNPKDAGEIGIHARNFITQHATLEVSARGFLNSVMQEK
jgi:glycosyltransferase involved in cell wall biosynthesis